MLGAPDVCAPGIPATVENKHLSPDEPAGPSSEAVRKEFAMADMRLVVSGAGGRMGQTLVRLIAETSGVVLAGALERGGSPVLGQDAGRVAGLDPNGVIITDDPLTLLTTAEGILDFTAPAASVELAALAAQMRIVHVVGTTGMSKDDEAHLRAAARHAVVVRSGNMSLGVNLLAAVVKRVARALDADFDIEIVEMHHNRKVDAPSGTALLLGQAAAAGRNIDLDKHSDRARDGHPGARRKGDIGFVALRGGTVIGDHTVIFAGEGERIEFTHRAESRVLFARGALRAALWARDRKPGFYSMMDVLGLADL
jgi:4-hydroxy-tetrahydrodipicolinate reductase